MIALIVAVMIALMISVGRSCRRRTVSNEDVLMHVVSS